MKKCPSRDKLMLDILSDMSWSQIAEKYGYSDSRFLRKKASEWKLPPKRTILKPSKNDLEDMICNQHLTPLQIAQKFGYGDGGWSNIYKYCRDYNIDFDYSVNYKIRNSPFTERQKAIVFGTVLGDGYLRPTGSGKSYALALCHGEKQIDYLRWKFNEFENFVITKKFYINHPNFHGNAPTYSFSTISHPFLKQAHDICYPNNKKDVTKEWIANLTPLSLAVWYLDDGSLNKRYKTIVLCTNSFSYEGQMLLVSYLKNTFDIDCKLEPRRNNQTVIRINASQSKKFINIIAEYVPECMNYKLW